MKTRRNPKISPLLFLMCCTCLANAELHIIHQLKQLLVDNVVLKKVLLHVRDVIKPRQRSLALIELLQLLCAHLRVGLPSLTKDAQSSVHHRLHASERRLCKQRRHARHLASGGRHSGCFAVWGDFCLVDWLSFGWYAQKRVQVVNFSFFLVPELLGLF